MIRVVLAVALTAALLGIGLPAVDRAQVDHSDAVLERDAERIAAGIDRLAGHSAPGAGARWVVTLHLPAQSWGDSGTDRLAVRNRSVRWRARRGAQGVVRVEPRIVEGVTLRAPGRHRLVVRLVERDGQAAVVVRRLEFKSESAASRSHAGTAAGRRTVAAPRRVRV